jgi:hypothetical protein
LKLPDGGANHFRECFSSDLPMETCDRQFGKSADRSALHMRQPEGAVDGLHILTRRPVHSDLCDRYAVRHEHDEPMKSGRLRRRIL